MSGIPLLGLLWSVLTPGLQVISLVRMGRTFLLTAVSTARLWTWQVVSNAGTLSHGPRLQCLALPRPEPAPSPL